MIALRTCEVGACSAAADADATIRRGRVTERRRVCMAHYQSLSDAQLIVEKHSVVSIVVEPPTVATSAIDLPSPVAAPERADKPESPPPPTEPRMRGVPVDAAFERALRASFLRHVASPVSTRRDDWSRLAAEHNVSLKCICNRYTEYKRSIGLLGPRKPIHAPRAEATPTPFASPAESHQTTSAESHQTTSAESHQTTSAQVAEALSLVADLEQRLQLARQALHLARETQRLLHDARVAW